jgi:lipopolysaccharide/colanic/teichoic acid biosynthesis glycosyltransferase
MTTMNDVSVEAQPRTARLRVVPLGEPLARVHDLDVGLEERRLVSRPDIDRRPFQKFLKRCIDITGSALLIAILAIPALLIAIAIKLDSRGPVFVVQTRTGRFGRTFRMIKFRTMCEDAEFLLPTLRDQNEASGPIFKMRDDPRMTRFGRWLRRASIDELPQLLNVFVGSMSLVGPRPPLPHEVAVYSQYQMGRLAVKPGLTGLWQVSGRSLVGFDDMVDLDLEYIRDWHLSRDIWILARTFPAVVSGRGAF